MPFIIKHILSTILISTLIVTGFPVVASAENISLTPEINIESDCDRSEAELIMRISIPKGTSISSMPALIEKVMNFYKGLWTGSDPIVSRIVKSDDGLKASDFAKNSKAVLGVDSILAITRAFQSVEEQGLSEFPKEILVISREKFPVVIDCMLKGKTQVSGMEQSSRMQIYKDENICMLKRDDLKKNLHNTAAALLSFRSQHKKLPVDFDELRNSGHLLIKMENPYTSEPLKFMGECGPGTIAYSKPNEGRFVLTAYDNCNLPIREEVIAGPDNNVKGVLAMNVLQGSDDKKPFSKTEQMVRIYIYQIDKLINSFFGTYSYMPKTISHIQGQGFASVGFINPYTHKPIQPVIKMNEGKPGEYWFWVIDENEYILIGYGDNGRKVIEIHRKIISRF